MPFVSRSCLSTFQRCSPPVERASESSDIAKERSNGIDCCYRSESGLASKGTSTGSAVAVEDTVHSRRIGEVLDSYN